MSMRNINTAAGPESPWRSLPNICLALESSKTSSSSSHVSQLLLHIVNPMYSKAYFCPICTRPLDTLADLKTHIQDLHTKRVSDLFEKSFQIQEKFRTNGCPACSAVFTNFCLVPQHLRGHHSFRHMQEWQGNPENVRNFIAHKDSCPSLDSLDSSPNASEVWDALEAHEKAYVAKSPVCRRLLGKLERNSEEEYQKFRFELPKTETPQKLPKTLEALKESKSPKIFSVLGFWRKLGCLRRPATEKPVQLTTPAVTPCKTLAQPPMVTSTPVALRTLPNPSPVVWNRPFPVQNFRRHLGSRFQCGWCQERFDEMEGLFSHQGEQHRFARRWFGKRFQCGLCSQKFRYSRKLFIHLLGVHNFN